MSEKTNRTLLIPENMIRLYAEGAFPMADEDNVIRWYYPEIRTLIPLNDFNCPRSLRKFMEKSDFEYRYDYDVMNIVFECSRRTETWISQDLIDAYEGLLEKGWLHSVEVWQKGKLVGGLYGVSVHGAFFGESMFSRVSQASKSALVKLVERLNQKNFKLLDVQFITEHLQMFGAIEVEYSTFDDLRLEALTTRTSF